jgi:hypothetical protein
VSLGGGTLSQREVEILLVALRYWRTHRGAGVRRTDPGVTLDAIDGLLAKLSASSWPEAPGWQEDVLGTS